MQRFVLTAFFDGRPQDGGAYIHKRNMLKVFRLLQEESIRVVVICSTPETVAVARQMGIEAVLRRKSVVKLIWGQVTSLGFVKRYFGGYLSQLPFGLDHLLSRLGTDLAVFTGGDGRVLQLLTHNYVIQLWDFCHLEHPEFPKYLIGESSSDENA